MVSHPHYQPQRRDRLTAEQSISLLYHDIFGYPLKEKELYIWSAGTKMKLSSARPRVAFYSSYYFLADKNDLVTSRAEKELFSREKMKMLGAVREVLMLNENILMVGITGSLAMNSASKESDIDLMVITKKGTLWQTRLKTLLKLRKLNISFRRAGEREQSDRLCMNIWMDESDLRIEAQNPYTAHELAQIVPLINRGGAYDKLLDVNRWILNYWPNAVHIKKMPLLENSNYKASMGEKLSYYLQRIYMSGKKTREVVTPTRAFFHPMDWSSRVKKELSKRGVEYL